MAALLHAHPFVQPAHPVPASRRRTAGHRAAQPRFVVLGGGRAAAVPLAVPVLLAVALVLGTVVIALRVAQGAPPATTWRELAASSMADPAPVPASGDHVITVRSGDTLWGIAQRLAPGRDPRPLVAELTRANGGSQLRVGQRVVVPAHLGAGWADVAP